LKGQKEIRRQSTGSNNQHREHIFEDKKNAISVMPFLACVLCSAFFILFLSGCTKKEQIFKESRVLMDTFCTITVVSPSKEKAGKAIDAGFAEIKKLETLLNYFSDQSEVTAINRAAGLKTVKVSRETMDVLNKTAEISVITAGAFDPTIAPVIKRWNFTRGASTHQIPSLSDIKRLLKLVDYSRIHIIDELSEVILEEKGMEIDLGGIAKGYAADKAVEAIKNLGIKSALVAIAGDIRGYGKKAWKVGVQNPRPDPGNEKPWEDIFATLDLRDRAISTSGDYQRYFVKAGKRYHHILDPNTGFPAVSDVISATVIAPEGYLSDSLATAVFVLGAERGIAILESNGFEGIVVNSKKRVIVTRDLKDRIKIINNNYQFDRLQIP
jgi:thiamine biosynthesis lipoprotein